MRTRPPSSIVSIFAVVASIALVVVVVRWIDAPDPGRHSSARHGPCHECGQQLRGLAVGILLWAESHRGQLPARERWVDLLVEEGYAPREMFTLPEDPVRGRISYIYVPAESIDPTGKRVLLYEPPGLHADCGVHIAFHDGHVELHQGEEAQRIIGSLTLPRGVP
ncbi:MAG TPA: hypothetical protein VFF69_14555 [Phycisphaerales bacterium]|nr:hypothetical protein [Phycisphaerales bacterium]